RRQLITTGLCFLLQRRLISVQKPKLRTCQEYAFRAEYTSARSRNSASDLLYDDYSDEIYKNKRSVKYEFLQLIKNAIDAMPLGGEISIEVTEDTSDSILIRVSDEGKGIEEEAFEKVKQPFYTTKTNRLGLALTICNNIIKEHKGSFTLKSNKNKGTIVEITLPITLP